MRGVVGGVVFGEQLSVGGRMLVETLSLTLHLMNDEAADGTSIIYDTVGS